MANVNQFKKAKKYKSSAEEPPFGHGLGQANAQKSLKNLQKADFIHDLGGPSQDQPSYLQVSKDFAASAEALGMAENRASRLGDEDHPENLNRLNYNRAFNLNVNSQDIDGVKHVKLSELDDDAMDSPRTSKLLAVRDQASSMAASSSNQFGGGDTSELLNPQDIAAAAQHLQNLRMQPLRQLDHQSTDSLNPAGSVPLAAPSSSVDSHPKQQQSRISQPGAHQGSYIDHSLSEGLKQQLSAPGGGGQLATGLIRGGLGLERDQEGGHGDNAVRDVEDINLEVRDELGAVQLIERSKGKGGEQKLVEEMEDDHRDRSGNYEVEDIDYARFLHMDADQAINAAKGPFGIGSLQNDQLKELRDEENKVLFGDRPEPSNMRFEHDLQSNEISLQDMHRRFNLKSELLDEEDRQMLSGMNALNYSDSLRDSESKGRPEEDSRQFANAGKQLQHLDEQERLKQSHQFQLQQELKEVLARSSSEQLLEVIDQDEQKLQDFDEEDGDLARIHKQFKMEKALVSGQEQQFNELLSDADRLFLGEQPAQQNKKKETKQEGIEREKKADGKILGESASPPILSQSKPLKQTSADQSPNQKLGTSGIDQVPKRAPNAENSPPKSEKPKKQARDPDRQPIDQAPGEHGGEENDSFHRLYNKEIKVNQDEIPLLLLELTDIAFKFIKKDQWEKAYVLLQKTESVLEVVNLDHSKRDRYFAYITYHNMAMCFQKLGMLEECIIYLKETIQVLQKQQFFKDLSIALRMRQSHMLCQLKLQLCAILSQTQKHSEAMENAKYSVRLAHQILRDMYDLCVFYSNKIKFKDDFASLSLLLMDDAEENQQQNLGSRDSLKGAGESSSAEKQGTKALGDGSGGAKHTKSEINEKLMQRQFVRENSPVRDIPFNILEESISMIERTALKLLPIMKELGNRLAGTQGKKGLQAFHTAGVNEDGKPGLQSNEAERNQLKDSIRRKLEKKERGLLAYGAEDDADDISQAEEDIKDTDIEVKASNGNAARRPRGTDDQKGSVDKAKQLEDQVDMRTILGFLNQNEWILNLNIGNIMQIQPVRMRDFMQMSRNEHQLSRESFLEKLQLLIVSYFCVSTEMRFIVQQRQGFMKPEVKKEKEMEQEYWHVKALDIACAFLPSECPLFNHILLSYQKHHDPTMQQIDEDKEQEDEIRVLRPLRGIENSKYQPIIRELKGVHIDVADIPMSPLSTCFDKRLKPKRVKTNSIDIQTEVPEEPQAPLMLSQSISVQEDLKPVQQASAEEAEGAELTLSGTDGAAKKYTDGETQTDVKEQSNAYEDISSNQKWQQQEQLISQLIEGPPGTDKQAFLNRLLTRIHQIQDQESIHQQPLHYQTNTSLVSSQPNLYGQRGTQYQNTTQSHFGQNQMHSNNSHSQNVYSQELIGFAGPHQNSFSGRYPPTLQSTIEPNQMHGQPLQHSISESVQNVYGSNNQNHQVLAKNRGNKITQSGQINYNPAGVDVELVSFEQRGHVRSLYGDATSEGAATAMAPPAKHQIVSQSLAPLRSVMATDQKTQVNKRKSNLNSKSSHPITAQSSHTHLNRHKKNASISGNSHDFLANPQSEFAANIGGAIAIANNSYKKQTIDHSTATMPPSNTANHLVNSVNSASLIENSQFGMAGPSSRGAGTLLKKKQKSTDAFHGRGTMAAASNAGLAQNQGHRGSHMLQGNQDGARLRIGHHHQGHPAHRLLKNDRHFSNINLSNQKNQKRGAMKGPARYIQNFSYNKERPDGRIGAVGGTGGGAARQSAAVHRANSNSREKINPATILSNPNYRGSQSKTKTMLQQAGKKGQRPHALKPKEDSLIKELDDVMSSSSAGSSNADPDLHPEPQSSSRCSDAMNNTNPSPSRVLVNQSSTSQEPKRTKSKKRDEANGEAPSQTQTQAVTGPGPNGQGPRASSELTNYTSGHSALKGKGSKQRLQAMAVSSTNIAKYQKQLAKLQQQQNYVTSMKQAKQRQGATDGPLVTKKKTKVLSRKKYGSDRSSNSPTTNIGGQRLDQPHGFSIAQQPVSIFDHANAHSISKLSLQLPQQPGNQLDNNSQSELNLHAGMVMALAAAGDSSTSLGGKAQHSSKHVGQSQHAQSHHPMATQAAAATAAAHLLAADSKLSIQNPDFQQTAFHSVSAASQSVKPSSTTGLRPGTTAQQHSATQLGSTADKKKKKHQQSQQKEARQVGAAMAGLATGQAGKNQSENILAKLQNLLVCKEQHKTAQAKRANYHQDGMQQQMLRQRQVQSATGFHAPVSQVGGRSANSLGANKRSTVGGRIQTGTGSNNRKSANSIGSQGRSNTRLSRYSQNSKYSRSKSRVSRSKSSGKSGEKPAGKSKSLSNERKNSKEKKLSNERKSQKVENSRLLLTRKSQTKHNIHDVPILSNIQNQMLHSQSQLDSHPAAAELLERAQSSFEMNHVISDLQNSTAQDKKRKSRQSSVLRNRPKSSMLPEQKKENMQSAKSGGVQKKKLGRKQAAQQQAHNSSIENLQRQVLENQKILLNNLVAQRSQKPSKRHPNHSNTGGPAALSGIGHSKTHHNHNNSITQMNNLTSSSLQGPHLASGAAGMGGAGFGTSMMKAAERTAGPGLGLGSQKSSKAQFQSQTTQNLHGHLNKSFLSSGTSGTKKKASGGANRQAAQTSANTTSHNEPAHSSAKAAHQQPMQQHIQGSLNHSHMLNNYNKSQIMSHLASNKSNLQRNEMSLKMTQPNLQTNFKPLTGPATSGTGQHMQAVAQSTSTSTAGAGQFLSGKSMKNRKSTGANSGPSGLAHQTSSGTGNNAGKRRSSINQIRQQQQQQYLTNQQLGHFVNFEQMQQQLEGGMTLGGVDLLANNRKSVKHLMDSQEKNSSLQRMYERALNMEFEDDQQQFLRIQQSASTSGAVASPTQQLQQQQLMNMQQLQQMPSHLQANEQAVAMNFVPHKHLMPKTTGSQVHLLSMQDPNAMKQYNSLNQTAKMMASSLTKNSSGLIKKQIK